MSEFIESGWTQRIRSLEVGLGQAFDVPHAQPLAGKGFHEPLDLLPLAGVYAQNGRTVYMLESGPIGAFTAPHDDPATDAAIIDYVSTFVPKMSGENFNPHVSTGVAPRDYLDRMLAEPFGTEAPNLYPTDSRSEAPSYWHCTRQVDFVYRRRKPTVLVTSWDCGPQRCTVIETRFSRLLVCLVACCNRATADEPSSTNRIAPDETAVAQPSPLISDSAISGGDTPRHQHADGDDRIPMNVFWDNGVVLESPDRAFRLHVGGRFDFDNTWYHQSSAPAFSPPGWFRHAPCPLAGGRRDRRER